jgi:hypothetical protein
MKSHSLLLLAFAAAWPGDAVADPSWQSHPPIRPPAIASSRPMEKGPAHFVDARTGDDANDGSETKPWRTIHHALEKVAAGESVLLRGGTYFENVYCAVAGTAEKPITIRSFPSELAVIDGGLPEFQRTPATAWEPAPDGVPGEFRSAAVYRNIRDVLGLFGDSNVGLQTYWHAMDLRATNEMWIADPDKKIMVLPVWCGPGLWYDKQTGRIHVRLAPTQLPTPGVPNYQGESDPRKLPLVIAPFNSVPLFVDQAMHVRFQDLVFRGGGQNTVVLQFGVNVEFDNVTIYAGTYGIRSRSTGPLRLTNCAVRGMIPPWASRDENSLHTYTADSYDPFVPPATPANARNVARLNTHALVVTEGSYEFEVFYYPHNHDWDIAHSEFSDGHDGVYLSGRNIRFHHNWVDGIQDDAIYLSAPSASFNDNIRLYENLITRALMAFSCHSRGGPDGTTSIYRNIADLRRGVFANRPSPKNPEGTMSNYHIFLTHGRGFSGIESILFYQNTFICPSTSSGGYAHRTLSNTSEPTQRRVFNNLCVYLTGYPPPPATPLHDIQIDGNLHWSPAPGAQPPKGFLEKARSAPGSVHNQPKYPPGWEANSFVADPKFVAFGAAAEAVNDYHLQPDSPAVGKGIVLPAELEDPFRPKDSARPDIGALPLGSGPLRVGIRGRVDANGKASEKE